MLPLFELFMFIFPSVSMQDNNFATMLFCQSVVLKNVLKLANSLFVKADIILLLRVSALSL